MTKKINGNFAKIISLLNDGQYHDGTTIGDTLGMTRSAVWKTMQKLVGYEVEIHSIKGKGYALMDSLILLDPKKIKQLLELPKLNIEVFETITSTNEYLKKNASDHKIKICLSEEQTQGRGRFNREWHAPFGQNIYFSCCYPFQKDVSELAGLSLVVSLAVFKTLKDFGIDDVCVKWPNDIIYQQKKLAGVLIEVIAETHGMSEAIIGIGLNVNMISDQDEIATQWTSLRQILGKMTDRNMLVANLIRQLFICLDLFKQQGFVAFSGEWMQADSLTNQFITLKNGEEKTQGTVAGVNDQGHLLLRLKNGNIRAFSAGDTTMVKK